MKKIVLAGLLCASIGAYTKAGLVSGAKWLWDAIVEQLNKDSGKSVDVIQEVLADSVAGIEAGMPLNVAANTVVDTLAPKASAAKKQSMFESLVDFFINLLPDAPPGG